MTTTDRNDFACAECGKEFRSGDNTAFRERKILHLDCALPFLQPAPGEAGGISDRFGYTDVGKYRKDHGPGHDDD